MRINDFLLRLDGVKETGESQWLARCPAHDDTNPSLSISEVNGKILICCHTGCAQEKIVQALGLKMSDLFADPPKEKHSGGARSFAREHIYTDADGHPLAKKQIYRSSDGSKTATWQRFENGKYVDCLHGMKVPLYKLPELTASGDTVFMPEGEKDVETLCSMGLTATTTPDGAGSKWNTAYNTYLQGKRVVVLTDNDEAGNRHGATVADGLKSVAKSVQVVPTAAILSDIKPKGDISDIVEQLGLEVAKQRLFDAVASSTALYDPAEAQNAPHRAKTATQFGEDNTHFLWYPYIPIGDYTVLMADGGTGKTMFCCGIAAAVSKGSRLPGNVPKGQPQKVLFISAEDRGEVLKMRLENSGADLNNVLIIDCEASEGMNITDKLDEFEAEINASGASLVIVDPWHAFLGDNTDINRVNRIRPVLQRLANMAKRCDCALLLISHINKRAQGENANNAAIGSTDLINAARSAIRIIFDTENEDCRIAIHTKTNYAPYGESVRFRIENGGLLWDGYSDITRATLEEAARKKTSVFELQERQSKMNEINLALIDAVQDKAPDAGKTVRLTYDDIKEEYGSGIFKNKQPKKALDAIAVSLLSEYHILITTGKKIKRDGGTANGFFVERMGCDEAASGE